MQIPLRVLIVEDEDSIRTLISRYLSRAGFAVATACDGKEAIECLAEADFDVLVLDLMMPRVTGFEVLSFLAESERALIRRTIIASACVPPAAVSELKDVCKVIRKPFDLQTLLAAVTDCAAS